MCRKPNIFGSYNSKAPEYLTTTICFPLGLQQTIEQNPMVYRSYMPSQMMNKNSSIIPYWLSLNSDDSILAIILLQLNTNSWYIILYDVVKLIQMPESIPICSPIYLSSDSIGNTIQYFTWNPAST
ncbi:unnamed protein product, partial [Rotaria sp. Silwood1]